MSSTHADVALTDRGLFESRAKAARLSPLRQIVLAAKTSIFAHQTMLAHLSRSDKMPITLP